MILTTLSARRVVLCSAVLLAVTACSRPSPFTQGDHIVIIGSALADRMQHDGWLETYLQVDRPDLELVIRNQGFTGDRVDARPRSEGFPSPDDYLGLSQADVVFASSPQPEAMLEVLYTMRKIGMKTDNPTISYPYLQAIVEATEGIAHENEKLASKRAWLLPDYALFIEKDVDKAVALRKDVLPDGWEEDATQLNNFAWWCFENQVNLDEAEELARRGVELAEPGTPKANVLDTLAEICNSKDDCSHAVEYIRLAIAEDPENEYFQNQLTRFEEILAFGE